MTFHATEWEWDASTEVIPSNPVTIHEARQMDGTLRYAVRQAGACLNKSGKWEYEPMPSSRDDAFLSRCRFDTWDDAANAILKFCKPRGRL